MALTHESPMPYGEAHKGKIMEDVPADYLMKLSNRWAAKKVKNKNLEDVLEYVSDNLDIIEQRLEYGEERSEEDYNERLRRQYREAMVRKINAIAGIKE